MIEQLLTETKAAILKRNPKLGQYLSPGMGADVVRKGLKKAGVGGNVEEVVALFSHFDGASCPADGEVARLGFAPPTVKQIQLDPMAIRILEANGKKVDPNPTVFGNFYFCRWEGVAYGLKTWRKFASNPRNAVLLGRVVTFFGYGQTGQVLAFDTDPSGNGRIISIQPSNMKGVPALTQEYASFEEFLRDLIDANLNNRCLNWPLKLEAAIELPMPAAPKEVAKPKGVTLAATEKLLVVRTDFSNDAGWEWVQSALGKTNDESSLSVQFVSDAAFAGLTAKQLPQKIADGYEQPIAVLADAETFTGSEQTLLVVDLRDKPGRSFRSLPGCLHEVFDNLSVANMAFAEFVKAAKGDGVYRGEG
jgi:hypothetical protein